MKLVIVRNTNIDEDKRIFTNAKKNEDRNAILYVIALFFVILTELKIYILGYTIFSIIWICIEFTTIIILLWFTYRDRCYTNKALENIESVNHIYATAVDSNTADVRVGTDVFRLRSKLKTSDIVIVYTSGCILFYTDYVDTLPIKDNV